MYRKFAIVFMLLTIFGGKCLVASAQRRALLNEKLNSRLTLTWQDQELALAIQRLADTGQIAIWLDRRVDRQLTVNLQLEDVPMYQALEAMAQQHQLGIAQLDEILYIGPEQSALELPTLLQLGRTSLSRLPSSARQRWLKSESTKWPKLSEPRKLIKKWLQNTGFELEGEMLIPHDLYAARSLPKMALIDRIVLILSEFDLTCQISSKGNYCEIHSIQRPLQLTQTRPRVRPQRQNNRKRPKDSRQIYSLKIKNQPLGRVLEQFARQLQLEVTWEDALKEHVNAHTQQLVSCDVKNVSLNGLLRSILEPVGLRHKIEGKQLLIRAKP